ncbi:MAG: hypothetical protein ACRDWA_18135 [Acidimicrobiia bacterium]
MKQGVGRVALFLLLLAAPITTLIAAVSNGYGTDELAIDLVSLLVYGGVSGLVIFRKDGHPVGWLLLLVGALLISVSRVEGMAALSPAARTWVGNFGWPLVFGIFTLLCLIFPSGRLPTGPSPWARLGRLVGRWLLPVVLILVAILSLEDGPASGVDTGSLFSVPWTLTMVVFGGSALSLLVRRRRATGAERAQLAWVVFPLALLGAVAILTTAVILISIATGNGDPGDDVWTPVYLVFLTFPIAFGVAVLRYKLYEIDRIISRTVSYSLLTVVLVVLYLGAVFVLGALFPQQSDLAVAASTLLAAAAFNPVRRRIQSAVDRKFNRSRFDAERTMDALSRRLAVEVNLDALGHELRLVASETMQPREVAVWLR